MIDGVIFLLLDSINKPITKEKKQLESPILSFKNWRLKIKLTN